MEHIQILEMNFTAQDEVYGFVLAEGNSVDIIF